MLIEQQRVCLEHYIRFLCGALHDIMEVSYVTKKLEEQSLSETAFQIVDQVRSTKVFSF